MFCLPFFSGAKLFFLSFFSGGELFFFLFFPAQCFFFLFLFSPGGTGVAVQAILVTLGLGYAHKISRSQPPFQSDSSKPWSGLDFCLLGLREKLPEKPSAHA